jgi:FkbM family methyltransferase
MVRTLSRSARAAKAAARVRNQANLLIGYHYGPSFDPTVNGEHWLQRRLGNVETFIDAGANKGDWTATLLSVSPSASGVLFEPSAELAGMLRKRFAGNPRIEVLEAALGESIGSATLFDEGAAGETSSLVPGVSFAHGRPREVPLTVVDDELEARGMDRVDVLKIDVEGFDLSVLRGAKRLLRDQRVGVVQFEYNRAWLLAGATLTAAVRLLHEVGYEVFVLRGNGLEPFDAVDVGDFFSYTNFVAVAQTNPLGEFNRD